MVLGWPLVSRMMGTPAKTVDDLKGKKWVFRIETTPDYAAGKMIENGTDMNLRRKFDAMLDAFNALEGKTIDYLTDKPGWSVLYTSKNQILQHYFETLSNEPIGITMCKRHRICSQKIEETLQKLR